MAILVAFLVFIPFLMIQIGILSNLPLLQGYPDLILLAILAWSLRPEVRTAWQWGVIGGLLMTLVSAMPVGVYLLAYLLVVAIAQLIRRMVWRLPFLTMLVMTILGTFLTHSLSLIVLQLLGRSWSISFALGTIIIPSVLYNLILALPIHAVISELAKWVYPVQPIYES
jgi:rod shape-determining protein MreD